MIAIVGNLDSTLAREAAVALDAFAEREAGPHGLVPTASVAVALAIGDALALTVMERRASRARRFAANHPSGRLGRRLTLRVRDVMHAGERATRCRRDAPLLDVVGAITERRPRRRQHRRRRSERLLGIITDGDVRRALQRRDPAELARAARGRGHDARAGRRSARTRWPTRRCKLMEDRPSQIAVLPVVEDGRCVGLVRLHDLCGSGSSVR